MSEETKISEQPTITIDGNLAERIREEIGENVYLCYQCVKCTSGCPVAEYFDWQPNQIMRAVQLGQEDIALQSKTPWLCSSCLTCTTRCPHHPLPPGFEYYGDHGILDPRIFGAGI